MSKIKWGAIVVDGRGKLGGHVFTKTRSGATMRTKVTPVNPQTSAQAAARSRLGNQSAAWRGMSEENRRGWNELALEVPKTNIFGDNYFPTGKNLFTGLNANLLLIGGSTIETPPSLVAMPAVRTLDIFAETTPGALNVEPVYEGEATGCRLVIEATALFSPGKFNFDGAYRFLKMEMDPNVGPFNVLPEYTAKFGPLIVGRKLAIRCYLVSAGTGQASPKFSASTIVVV